MSHKIVGINSECIMSPAARVSVFTLRCSEMMCSHLASTSRLIRLPVPDPICSSITAFKVCCREIVGVLSLPDF